MKECYIHIGYPKTATTFLQRVVFKHNVVSGSFFFFKDSEFLLENIITAPIGGFNAVAIKHKINQLNTSAKPILISLERLAGNPFQGGVDGELIANRLKAIFPEAKILVSIRNQSKMIDALYKQYIFQGGGHSFQAFLKDTIRSSLFFNLDYLKFDALIAHYEAHYGRDNILVLPYELLSNFPNAYFDLLNSFFEFNQLNLNQFVTSKRLNSSNQISTTALEFMRFCNGFYSTWAQPRRVFPGIKHHKKLRKHIQGKLGQLLTNKHSEVSYVKLYKKTKQINNHYADSNYLLAQKFDLDLENLGYSMPNL